MHSQDHKMTATSTGHEGHEVHLCHRCGWPFPNPHPSSKHRRAHKRVCGTIEGYKVIHSEEHDHHLSVSDDEHASDGDEHTPSPNIVKKKAEDFASGGGVGGKSNRSEDDVFSDAVTEFPDSGISPRLEERFDNVRGLDKSIEQKVLEGDSGLVKVDETADRTEKLNNSTMSEETSNYAALLTYTNAEAVSVGLINGSHGHGQEDKLDSVTLDSEVVKHDLPSQIENLQNLDASAAVKSVPDSTQISSSTEIVREIALVEETNESDASSEVKEVSHSSEVIGSVAAPDEHSVDEDKKTSLAGVDTVSVLGAADDTSAIEDDQTTKALKKDVDHCEDKSNNELVETGNEKGEGDSVEVKAKLDSTISSDNSTDVRSSCAADSDARNLEELSKTESSSLESKDNGSKLNHDIGDVSDEISPPIITSEDPPSPVPSEQPNSIQETNLAGAVIALKDNDETVASELTPEQPITREVAIASDSIDAAEVSAQLNPDGKIEPSEDSDSLTPKEQEALHKNNCSNGTSVDVEERHSSEDVSISKSLGIVSSVELTSDGNFVTSEKTSATGDRKDGTDVENVTGVNSKSLQDEVDDKLTKHEDDVSAIDLSGSSCGGSGSLEGNCGSVSALSFQSNMAVAETNSQSPDTLETNSQKQHKTSSDEGHPDKSDIYEPPSFMTLVQSDDSRGNQATAAAEIETVQNNQKPKADALQTAWFPSLTNVSNESEGRKKNEEIIAKVTNWSPGRQHGPLKSLLSDVNSPKSNEVPDANQKNETSCKENGAEATLAKDHDTNKDMEEWNSPARYPIEIKKEKKKKGKSYWVPFVCCSSVHRDH